MSPKVISKETQYLGAEVISDDFWQLDFSLSQSQADKGFKYEGLGRV